MPSPSARLKAARRLPKRLRTSGEAPDGDIARMREEASARYERGESSSSTLHSCHQRPSKSWADTHPGRWANNQWSWDDTWTTSWCEVHGWTQDEQAGWTHSWRSDTYPSSDGWDSAQAPKATPACKDDRPLPPTPPTPRRQRQEQLSKPGADGGRQEDQPKGEAAKVMAAIKSKPQHTRNRRRGASPGPNSAVHTTTRFDHPDKRPSATVTSLNVKEPDNLGRSSTAGPEKAMDEDRQGPQNAPSSALSRDSDDVELIQSDQEKDNQPEAKAGPPHREQPSSGSQAPTSASGGPSREDRPGGGKWTREDTELSKAMSRLLRHESTLQLDQAGYAKLSDMLRHPRLRHLHPTMEWMMHIVRHNAKQRFARNEAGARTRANQGHSTQVDPSQLLRKLGTGDIGDMVPTTYFSNVRSIMKRGLLPGGTRGANYRQHVHLAVSHRPEAGLREGSDLILMVDLMRAHNAGCVFYISDNNVVLTADCIPPSCIVRATCTSTGAVFDLNQFRAKYMRGCAEPTWGLSARAALHLMITLSATRTRLLISSCGRCLLQPTFAQPGALISRPSYRDESRCSGHLMCPHDNDFGTLVVPIFSCFPNILHLFSLDEILGHVQFCPCSACWSCSLMCICVQLCSSSKHFHGSGAPESRASSHV